MKKRIIIVVTAVIILIAALVAIPYFFKPNILAFAKNELNKQLNARVEVDDLTLSLFSDFPRLSLQLRNLSLLGTDDNFRNDTLFYARTLRTSTNLKSLFRPSNMEVSEILLDGASIHLITSASGEVNWELGSVAENESESGETNADSSDFRVQLDRVEVRDAVIRYEDRASGMNVLLNDIDLEVSGEMFGNQSQLKAKGDVAVITLNYGGADYVANTSLGLETLLDVDFDKMDFRVADSELWINRLPLQLDGNLQMPNDTLRLDLKLNTKTAGFENFLALVPPQYEDYLKDIKTSGSANISGSVKGFYFGDNYPEIRLLANIGDGSLRYAGMPDEIKNIRAKIEGNKPQGVLDKMTINVSEAHAEIRNNPVDLMLTLSNLVSDPFFDASLEGKVNLAHLKSTLPLDSVEMSGLVEANIIAQGTYSAVETEAYEEIKTDGAILLKDFVYKAADLREEIVVPKGRLDFSPRKIDLSHFQVQVGKSDFSLTGAVTDYLAYLFGDETLSGNLRLESNHVDLNELLRLQVNSNNEEAKLPAANNGEEEEILAFDIPPRLDFTLHSAINTADLNGIAIRNIQGIIHAENEKLVLKNLDMNLLGGSMKMDGLYQNTPQNIPQFDFGFDVDQIDIPTMYNTLSGIQKRFPMAGSSTGKLNSKLKIAGQLSPQLALIPSSINGDGTLGTTNLEIVDSPVFNQLSGILKKEKLRNIVVDDFLASITISNGNLLLKPFSTRVIGQETTVEGRLNVDNLLDMRMDFMVEREAFGPDIQNILALIPGNEKIKILPAGVDISGPVGGPKVKPDLSKTTKAVTEATKDDVQKSLDKLGKGILKMFEK